MGSIYKIGIESVPAKAVAYRAGADTAVGAWFATQSGVDDAGARMQRDIDMMDADMIDYLKSVPCKNVPLRTEQEIWDLSRKAAAGDAAARVALDAHANLHVETEPECVRLRRFYDSIWIPFVIEWEKWWKNHDSWWENKWSTTSAYNKIDERRSDLKKMRTAAIAAGFFLKSPAPVSPDPGLLTGLGRDLGLGGIVDMVKIVIYGVVIIGGIVLISAARQGQAPSTILALRGR